MHTLEDLIIFYEIDRILGCMQLFKKATLVNHLSEIDWLIIEVMKMVTKF